MRQKRTACNSHLKFDQWFVLALRYYRKYGDLLVPRKFKINGYNLGRWIERRRAMHNGMIRNTMSQEEERMLEAIGMVWRLELRDDWDNWYALAADYAKTNGHCNIPVDHVVGDHALGNWLSEQRKKYRNGTLTPEKITKLEAIGVNWRLVVCLSWDKWYALAKEYYQQHGHLRVPYVYRTADNYKLGIWVYEQREKRNTDRRSNLTPQMIEQLDSIGMVWDMPKSRIARGIRATALPAPAKTSSSALAPYVVLDRAKSVGN